MSNRAMALATIDEFLESHDIDFEKSSETAYLLTLPGEKKLQTHCALVIGDQSLSINAFVIRKPDENTEAVHEWLLKKNATMYCVAFAINELGDIYLVDACHLAPLPNKSSIALSVRYCNIRIHLSIPCWS